MKTFQRISIFLLMIMTFILPFWLTLGRSMIGSTGYLVILYTFLIAPVLFILMLIFNILIWARRDVRQRLEFGKLDSFLLLLLYVSVFLHGFFVVDGSDTPESLGSVLTRLFGSHLMDVSTMLSGVAYTFSYFLLLICLAVFIGELIAKRLNK